MTDEDKTAAAHRFGTEILGPFVAAFTEWLRGEVRAAKPAKLFFFSRDGFLMQQAYEIADAKAPLGVPHEYVHFSRRALRTPLLHSCKTMGETLSLLSWQRYVSYSEVFSFWGLTDAEIRECVARTGDKVVPFEALPRCADLEEAFVRHADVIRSRSAEQFRLVGEYIRKIGMSGRVAIVDIGWHGTMQLQLEALLRALGVEADILGLYVGIGPRRALRGEARGFIYTGKDDNRRFRILCFFGGGEKLFQGFEGSTMGYEGSPDGVRPALDAFEYSDDTDILATIGHYQSAALDFVRGGRPGSAEPLLRFGCNPPSWGRRLFRRFFNFDNGVRLYLLPQKSPLRHSPREFVLRLSQSSWKTGFLRDTLRLPFLPYLTLYKLLKK